MFAELQVRTKWRLKGESSIQIGDLAIVKEDNLAPVYWKLGRVVEVHKGPDDVVRVATVQTSLGTYKRSITKLCSLPFEED